MFPQLKADEDNDEDNAQASCLSMKVEEVGVNVT